MHPPIHSDLAKLSGQLTKNNARVGAFVKSLPGWVDRMVDMAAQQDWRDVRQLSEYLALSSESCGCSNLHERACQLADECRKPDNELGIRRSVVRLIGACGRAGTDNTARAE